MVSVKNRRSAPTDGISAITKVGDEEWRDIPGCPGYQVSDRARVRSTKKRVLSQRGNRSVTMTFGGDEERPGEQVRLESIHVARLIYWAFHEMPRDIEFAMRSRITYVNGDHNDLRPENIVLKPR
jgi:hypothetical protein